MSFTDPITVVVVFDVNIYLDVARHIGEPFSMRAFNDEAVALARSPEDQLVRRHWSLLAVALTTSGRFAGQHSLEVWSSPHINELVKFKAGQTDNPGLAPEDCGLGWSQAHASALVDGLIVTHVDSSGGGIVEPSVPRGSPPLSHEDGLVYATGREAANGDELAERIIVTGDRDFLNETRLEYPRVLHPQQFVRVVRSARARLAMQSMTPNRSN